MDWSHCFVTAVSINYLTGSNRYGQSQQMVPVMSLNSIRNQTLLTWPPIMPSAPDMVVTATSF